MCGLFRVGRLGKPYGQVPLDMKIDDTRPASCDGCGACCMHALEPPFAGVNGVAAGNDPCWDAVPESLKMEIVDFRINLRPKSPHDQPCIWLDLTTKRCRHYEYRPKLCRDFEFGGADCLEFRERHISIANVSSPPSSDAAALGSVTL